MRARLPFITALAALGAASALAAPNVESHFNAQGDVEGWATLRVDTNTLTPLGAFGTPGWETGHLKATEESGGLFLLSAPIPFLGAKSAYYGGTVSYLLSDATTDPGSTLGFYLVKSDLSLALGYMQSAPATTATPFSVPLRADGKWYRYNGTPTPSLATDADIQSALSSLGFMGVDADWTTATTDVTTLDDFVLAPAPVPEPASLAALAVGALATLRRQKR